MTAWGEVLSGDLAPNLFWEPLRNTVGIGIATTAGSVLLGGAMAWVVVMTDVPGRRLLGLLASLPSCCPASPWRWPGRRCSAMS